MIGFAKIAPKGTYLNAVLQKYETTQAYLEVMNNPKCGKKQQMINMINEELDNLVLKEL